MIEGPPHTSECLRRVGAGDTAALAVLFDSYRDQLHRMVELRLDGGWRRGSIFPTSCRRLI
jgi:hypothetical protein